MNNKLYNDIELITNYINNHQVNPNIQGLNETKRLMSETEFKKFKLSEKTILYRIKTEEVNNEFKSSYEECMLINSFELLRSSDKNLIHSFKNELVLMGLGPEKISLLDTDKILFYINDNEFSVVINYMDCSYLPFI